MFVMKVSIVYFLSFLFQQKWDGFRFRTALIYIYETGSNYQLNFIHAPTVSFKSVTSSRLLSAPHVTIS